RPEYPDAVYQCLVDHRALVPNTATLEIGAGSGLATRRLIELGASPITVIEPDVRFAPLLRELRGRAGTTIRLVPCAFEDAELPKDAFDLVAAATSFHWLDPQAALDKVAEVLRPGGFVALWWNVFRDLDREDPFHDATRSILADHAISPSGAPDAMPFALDRRAREADFERTGSFDAVAYEETHWTLVLDVPTLGRLYEGFSHIQRLPESERAQLLRQLMEIARTQFGGRVERHMTSPIYLARRKKI
ncbi:MAG: class I SAM-dependent methyltransferase, partial [Acidobacteriota bacterium]